MKRIVAVAGLLLASGFSAFAADMPGPYQPPPQAYVPPAPPPVYNWTGFYVGGNAGFGIATAAVTAGGASASENLSGFVGGGQVGVNYQAGWAVFGIEADLDGTTQNDTVTAFGASLEDKIPWFGTVRGRIGAAFDRFLIYGTAGGGWGDFETTGTVPGFGSASASQSHFVFAGGAGVEVGLTQNVSARIEYLYLDTGNIDNIGGVAGVTGRVQDNLVRAGLNWRFVF